MGFFKSLFNKSAPAPTRTLTQPNQLQAGDIFCFGDSFSLPEAMRKQQLQVTEINTIEFQHAHYAQIIGQGSNDKLTYISFPKNPKQLIKCSLQLTRADVEALFDMDAFAEIFEAPGRARLTPITQQHAYASMVADEYIQQDYATSGYFHQADYRHSQPPQFSDQAQGREFEYFSLEGDQGLRVIDIFVFENGDTDIYLSRLHPANDIAELWIKGDA